MPPPTRPTPVAPPATEARTCACGRPGVHKLRLGLTADAGYRWLCDGCHWDEVVRIVASEVASGGHVPGEIAVTPVGRSRRQPVRIGPDPDPGAVCGCGRTAGAKCDGCGVNYCGQCWWKHSHRTEA